MFIITLLNHAPKVMISDVRASILSPLKKTMIFASANILNGIINFNIQRWLTVKDGNGLGVRAVISGGRRLTKWALPFLMASRAFAFTQITISTEAPSGIEQTLLSSLTTYFQADVKANPLIPNTYSVKIHGINQPQLLLGNSADTVSALGCGTCMDSERSSILNSLKFMQETDTNTVCASLYDVIGSTIAARWNQIYTSTGGYIAP